MANMISEETMEKALSWAWDKSINGVGGSGSADALADEYRRADGDIEKSIDSLIRFQVAKCGVAGFMTGLGGVMTIPVSLPADVVSSVYIQLRMIAAIASLCGKDIHTDQVQTMGFLCLCGNAAADVIEKLGVKALTDTLTVQGGKEVSKQALKTVNKAVTKKLVHITGEKAGGKGFSKFIPFIGGIFGCTVNVMTAKTIGLTAKKVFYESRLMM